MPTLGSLFDGIGGFPLAAVRNGIEPVWASEIEAFPIEVTRKRFPSIKKARFKREADIKQKTCFFQSKHLLRILSAPDWWR